ncbi:uncharacterized protein BXZ73DRAFT_107504 [Epithele typhae]|uniref:uncharacterized protein n=1 Tax=Epithele typhae TaxID=378194 RepID=UPI002008A7B7|nr:uncharacterized protein BXZ73DRAFT_107504 [Epithele typhae]KAH9912300.1 hypothetical protein BXZ73DRAFT_107504 [Epithele typhae]
MGPNSVERKIPGFLSPPFLLLRRRRPPTPSPGSTIATYHTPCSTFSWRLRRNSEETNDLSPLKNAVHQYHSLESHTDASADNGENSKSLPLGWRPDFQPSWVDRSREAGADAVALSPPSKVGDAGLHSSPFTVPGTWLDLDLRFPDSASSELVFHPAHVRTRSPVYHLLSSSFPVETHAPSVQLFHRDLPWELTVFEQDADVGVSLRMLAAALRAYMLTEVEEEDYYAACVPDAVREQVLEALRTRRQACPEQRKAICRVDFLRSAWVLTRLERLDARVWEIHTKTAAE